MTNPLPEGEKRDISHSVKALATLTGIMLIGILGTQVYALQAVSWSQFASFATIGLMIAGSSLLVGGLLGFLFGIPRTLQHNVAVDIPVVYKDTANENREQRVNYQANTNLEQISDWLTKILVGVGLTQITIVPEKLQQLSIAAATGFDNSHGSRTFVVAVILFFVISGFLFGYLWTRLFLPNAFRRADLSALAHRVAKASQEVAQVNRKLDELEKQTELDATALSLAQRQLNPSHDIPPVSQEELTNAIKAASRPIKIQIFNQAQEVRTGTWRTDKPKMELTIPIFQALIESDVEGRFHRNHAQLGFALKDQRNPDLIAAENELTKAIDLRGPADEMGWLYYEFNRAVCRINRDEAFNAGKASQAKMKKAISADLRYVAQSSLRKLIHTDPQIKQWMSLNDLMIDDLADIPGGHT